MPHVISCIWESTCYIVRSLSHL